MKLNPVSTRSPRPRPAPYYLHLRRCEDRILRINYGTHPLKEVPNAPQFAGPPQLAQMPDMPTIRAKYQTTKAEPINYRVDMSGEIAALQQKPLPGGFMEGTNRAAEAQKRTAQVGRTWPRRSTLRS